LSPASRDSKFDVEPSDGGAPRGAVFLSYASQDAAAAKRIADALRGFGVEVWFDQDELVGRDRIRTCLHNRKRFLFCK